MFNFIDIPFIKYYLKSLNEYDSFEIPLKIITKIKLFQKDKLICLTTNNDILIYDILEKKLLCKLEKFLEKKISAKIKLFKNDKFIIYSQEDLRIFQFRENKPKKDEYEYGKYWEYGEEEEEVGEENKYICEQITLIKEEPDDIIFKNKNLFSLNNGDLNIFTPINNTDYQFQTKIFFPKDADDFPDYRFLFIKDDKIKIIEYQENYIKFWSIKYYKLKLENEIELDNNILDDLNFAILNDKDSILFFSSNFYYLYSYKKKVIINKFRDEYKHVWRLKGISVAPNNEIYLNDINNIYSLDINNKEVFSLIKTSYELRDSLALLDGGEDMGKNEPKIFIVNSNNKIHFFKNSRNNIIKKDLFYIVFIFLFLFFPILYNNRNIPNSLIYSLEYMAAIFTTMKIFDAFSKLEDIYKKNKYLIIGGLVILFIASFNVISNILYIK
jgi:hypothetical protein